MVSQKYCMDVLISATNNKLFSSKFTWSDVESNDISSKFRTNKTTLGPTIPFAFNKQMPYLLAQSKQHMYT